MPAQVNPGSIETPREANTRLTVEAVERFARVLGYTIRVVNGVGTLSPGIICVPPDSVDGVVEDGRVMEFGSAELAAQTLKQMAYMRLYGGDAEGRMRADGRMADSVVAARLMARQWREAYPALTTFSDEVSAIVKEMGVKGEPTKEDKPLPRRIINLQDD